MASKHLKRALETRRDAYQEDVKREVFNHGQVRPMAAQVGTKTWASYSSIRRPSKEFRAGWDKIKWS